MAQVQPWSFRGPTAGSLVEALPDLVAPILEDLSRGLGYRRAVVIIFDDRRERVEAVLGALPVDEWSEIVSGLDDQGPVREALRTGRPVRVDNVLRDSRVAEPQRAHYADMGLVAYAAIPLLPVSAVLIIGRENPLTQSDIDAALPHVGRLVSSISEMRASQQTAASLDERVVSEEWLWWMVNSVQDAIVVADQANRIISQNMTAERLFITSPEDSSGKRRAIEMNNFLVSAALSSFVLDQAQVGPTGRELALVDPSDGSELLFEVILRAATNLRTGESGLVLVLKDVTDLRHATQELQRGLESMIIGEQEAQRERDRLNLVLENVGDPIIVTDSANEIMLMNPSAERLLKPGAVPGMAPDQVQSAVYVANDTKLSSFLSQLRLEPGTVRRGEIELLDPETHDGLPMGVTSTEVQDEVGRTTAIVSVLHDLTAVYELERKNVEQQLFESEKLAAVGRLAAAVAHEINNPMEAIKNALYLVVTSTPESDPNRRFLEIASRETDRVSGIIRQMLGFYSRKTDRAQTDLNRLLEETMELIERDLGRQRITIVRELDPKLPAVAITPDQIKQVFLNLFLNAKEAMPSGGELRVSSGIAGPRDLDLPLIGRHALVQVQDSGEGIARENMRHLFEPFFTTKHGQKGTGLGLWVCQSIVQQHGGQIQVVSRPGAGTTFSVALPTEPTVGAAAAMELTSGTTATLELP
jgi:PAS domain S-box-containing protein